MSKEDKQNYLYSSILGIEFELKSNQVYFKNNLLSFFLISSDLKGTVEQPSNYFELENGQQLYHLVLTQGWTNCTQSFKNLDFELEKI